MHVQHIDHFTLRVQEAQLPALLDFYVRVLRLREGDRPSFSFPGHWLYARRPLYPRGCVLMSYLQLQKIAKSFGDVQVVQEMDLSAAAGEFIVLVGASGCGKSTTLRMIAGLESPTPAPILRDGRDVPAATPADRDIAMVFQNYALYPHMNVAQNMSFALELSGTSKAVIAQRVDAAAQVLNIKHLLDRKPKELSGGQRQRVAMGRAIVREP